jgi:hypothetical protein
MRDGMLAFQNVDSSTGSNIGRARSAAAHATPLRRLIAVSTLSEGVETAASNAYDLRTLNTALESSQRHLFDQLVNTWLSRTQGHSSISLLMRAPEFNELVGMGSTATKLVLERMRRGEVRVHWFPLLKKASGVDPVPPDKRGVIGEMARAWLSWGREQKLLEA